MDLNSLTSFITVILAVSLASERLLTMAKAAFPWLAQEQKTDAREVDLIRDRPRRLLLLAMAWAASWIAASFLVPGNWAPASLFGQVPIPGGGDRTLHALLVGLLASSGSAFWNNILGFTKEVKDTKRVETAAAALEFNAQAAAQGKQALDSGQVANAAARAAGGGMLDANGQPRATAELTRMMNGPQPPLRRGGGA